MSRRVSIVAVALAALVGLAAAGCAPLPSETAPRAIDRERVPDLFPAPTTTVATAGHFGSVCFVSQVDSADQTESKCIGVMLEDVNPRTLVDALAAGPDEDRREKGLTSWVPQDTRLLDAETSVDDPEILVINLSAEINSLSSPNNIVAYRQIVETLTNGINNLGVRAIRLQIEGKPTRIPTDRGQLITADPGDFTDSVATTTTTTRGS